MKRLGYHDGPLYFITSKYSHQKLNCQDAVGALNAHSAEPCNVFYRTNVTICTSHFFIGNCILLNRMINSSSHYSSL